MFIEEWLLQKILREQQEEHSWMVFPMPYFREVSSVNFAVDKQELEPYSQPLTPIIEDNSLKEMQYELERRLQIAFDKLRYPRRGCF